MTKFLLFLCCFLVSNSLAQEIRTEVKVPKAINSPAPIYGDAVERYGIAGVVSVYARIDKEGKATVLGAFGPAAYCSDLRSPVVSAIQKAAIDAAAKSVFEPPLKDGKPTEVEVHLNYKFAPAADKSVENSGEVRPKSINGGVLNGKAKKLPKPHYPAEAGANRIGGAVSVQVLISVDGEVVTASAASGHPYLREPAVEAACKAKFAPTTLQGNPVKVSGVLTYNFVP